MLHIEERDQTIQVRFQGRLILNHTKDSPAFYLGKGTPTISSYRGNFDIEDFIEERIPLTHVSREKNTLTFSDPSCFIKVALEEANGRLVASFEASEGKNRFWIRIPAEEDEYVYGCGEQLSYFNLRGRNFPLFTGEKGVGRDPNSLTTFYANLKDKAGGYYHSTYYPETTFVTSNKTWFHLSTSAYCDFNFKHHNYHELMVWGIPEGFVFSVCASFPSLLTDLTDFTGRPPMLPEYLLDGMILGVQGGIELVRTYLEKAVALGVNVSGLWCQDWAGYRFTTFGKRLYWNWKWNQRLYPDLKQAIVDWEKQGIHFLTYICPFLLENESLFLEAESKGFLVLNQNNESYKEDFGEFYCGIVDLTNPQAFEWYKGVIKSNLIALGIKGWMADFGEYLPIDCVLHNGIDPLLMHNAWPVLWARCNYEAVCETDNLGKVFYFMRAGGFGSQKYATCLWAGDQSVNWEIHDGIRTVIPAALSSGMIGNPFSHSDIGGYTSLHGNIRTKELFDRWCEMNVFSSFMRTHEGNRPTQNFQFYNDEDTMRLMARMTSVRVQLKPYIQHLFEEAVAFGFPVQRPLFFHYENDLEAYSIQHQYLFGSDMLVAPVVEAGVSTWNVYLPEDEWVHLWTGIESCGKETVLVDAPIGYPPVFYRKNSTFAELFHRIRENHR